MNIDLNPRNISGLTTEKKIQPIFSTNESTNSDRSLSTHQEIKVFSFTRQGFEWRLIEVEVSLIPGLPQFQIMGLPDTSIKESQLRIKSALKHRGFSLLTGKQVLVNLKPHYLKKRSQGLDLAIACAYLWKTKQVQVPLKSKIYVYGVLDLEGGVEVPEDLEASLAFFYSFKKENKNSKEAFFSGIPKREYGYSLFGLKDLNDLSNPTIFKAVKAPYALKRPTPPKHFLFNQDASQLLCLLAAGGHSVLIAGPQGSGKTLFAQALHYLLPEPPFETISTMREIQKFFIEKEPIWPPFVSPHHTTPLMSILGGGDPPIPGELTRAHGGILFLDEFLNFNNEVKESLRTPVEKGEITVARRGHVKTFPADFQLLAATNLCHCGKLTPFKNSMCSYSLRQCRSYLDKLSGPLLDRFDILSFSNEWSKSRRFDLELILKKVEKTISFSRNKRNQNKLNRKLQEEEIQLDPFIKEKIMPQNTISGRRRLSLIRVARTLADMDESKEIQILHIERAYALSCRSFHLIQKIFN